MEITSIVGLNKISIKSHDAGHSKTQPQQLLSNNKLSAH